MKPRNTLWLHLSNSELWQLAGKTVRFVRWDQQEKCKFCSKAFYRESDRLQRERNCAAQSVAEPEGPPRRKEGKHEQAQGPRLDSRSREEARPA